MKSVYVILLVTNLIVGISAAAQGLFNAQDSLRVRLHAVHNDTANTLILVYRLSLCVREVSEAQARCTQIAQSPRFGVTAGEQITDARIESPPLTGLALNELLDRMDFGSGTETALQIELFDTAGADFRITRAFVGLPKTLGAGPRPLKREVAVDSPPSAPQYRLRTRLLLEID